MTSLQLKYYGTGVPIWVGNVAGGRRMNERICSTGALELVTSQAALTLDMR